MEGRKDLVIVCISVVGTPSVSEEGNEGRKCRKEMQEENEGREMKERNEGRK